MVAITGTRFNQSEYSRYYDAPDTPLHIIQCRVRIDTQTSGQTLTATLIQERNGEVCATKTYPLTTGTAVTSTVAINLQTDCFDPNYLAPITGIARKVYRAKQGWYHLHLVVTDGSGSVLTTTDTATFPISIVATAELRRRHASGFPALQNDVYMPVKQPTLVTGVTVKFISPNVDATTYQLTWDAGASTLQLANALTRPDLPNLAVPIDTQNDGTYILPCSMSGTEGDYMLVSVSAWDLPTGSISELLYIDNQYLANDVWREYLWEATGYIEGKMIGFLEPTRYSTNYEFDALAHVKDAPPADYSSRQSMNWMYTQIPSTPLLMVDILKGQFNTSEVMTVPTEWITSQEMSGLIRLVPNIGALQAWLFRTSNFLQFLFSGYPNVPNFWHYSVTVGLPDLFGDREIVREMIIKQAMINILTVLGSSYRGGVSAESTSRSGVSTSISYTSSASLNIYGADITLYREWMEKEIPPARQRIYGIRMRTLA